MGREVLLIPLLHIVPLVGKKEHPRNAQNARQYNTVIVSASVYTGSCTRRHVLGCHKQLTRLPHYQHPKWKTLKSTEIKMSCKTYIFIILEFENLNVFKFPFIFINDCVKFLAKMWGVVSRNQTEIFKFTK
jgi:hypothetical protein